MTAAWEYLIKNALLGTDRLSLREEELPKYVQQLLAKTDKIDKEDYLLKAITLTSIYEKGGELLPVNTDIKTDTAFAENLPYCSPLASLTWRKIQPWATKHPFLIQAYLDKVIDNQWIVTPDAIVPLLNLGATKKGEHLREKIAQVVGNRGVWLTSFYPKWNYILPTDYVKIFHEGKSSERLVALRQIRRTTPNMARVLLSETWKTELPKDKRAFLEVFSIDFQAQDSEFVAQCKADIAYQEREPLLSIFQSKQQIEMQLMNHKTLIYNVEWQSLPLYFNWSKEFSLFMLKATYESFQYAYFTRGAAFQPWFAHINPSISLENIPHISDRYEQKFQWAEYCSKELTKILEMKRMIAAF